MGSQVARRAAVAAVTAVAAIAWGGFLTGGRPLATVPTAFEEPFEISGADRAAGLRFAPTVAPGDRAWFEAAVAASRPEAQRLVAEVDGLVEVRTHTGDPFGVTEISPSGYVISLDVGSMNRDRVVDRESTVLHELGHVIDHALVAADLNRTLDAGIPRGACQSASELTGSCTAPEERFADTFAKWSLRGAVSQVGAGYGVATPPSLEGWGAPLGILATEIATRR
jgi:hypothetical protein